MANKGTMFALGGVAVFGVSSAVKVSSKRFKVTWDS